MKVESNVLDRQFRMFQAEYEQKALEVLRSGWYVLGSEVKAFEEEFAAYVDACKGVALYETGVSAAYGDKLITLSTCDDSGKNSRVVVVAKRITEPR